MAENRKHRQNLSPAAEIDNERERLPVSQSNLTPEERASLDDSDWIDEDEADAIICQRREKEEDNQARPFREYLRQRGIKVER